MGVTDRRPSSNSEVISRIEMRLLVCMTKGRVISSYEFWKRTSEARLFVFLSNKTFHIQSFRVLLVTKKAFS